MTLAEISSSIVFERHHQFDGIQRIGAEIFHEGSRILDVLFLDSELLRDDFLDAFFDAAHFALLLL